MITIEKLLKDNPKFHGGANDPKSWAASPAVLNYIRENVHPGARTLETGSGHTTVTFAMAGAKHVCITPNTTEIERISAYLQPLGFRDNVTFINDSSESALAMGVNIPETLDFVFIDGAHRYPFPSIDWHFTERRLKVGGIMGVDDCDMPSVRILYNFLSGEKEWQLLREIDGTAFFRKMANFQSSLDWKGQQMNAAEWWKAQPSPTLLQRVGRRLNWRRAKPPISRAA